MFATTFLHSGDCEAKIQPTAWRGKNEDDPRREVQIISIKNVPYGFSKKFPSPNLISEAVLFISYLSVSFSLAHHSHHRNKQNVTVGELDFVRKSRQKHF